MKAVQHRQQAFFQFFQGGPQPGTGSAGIVDGVTFLGRAFRIQPQADGFSRRLCPLPEFFHLPRAVEDQMVGVFQNFFEFISPVSRGKHMGLPAETRYLRVGLVEAAGGSSRQILSDQGVHGKHGEGFLGQQDLAAGPVTDLL